MYKYIVFFWSRLVHLTALCARVFQRRHFMAHPIADREIELLIDIAVRNSSKCKGPKLVA